MIAQVGQTGLAMRPSRRMRRSDAETYWFETRELELALLTMRLVVMSLNRLFVLRKRHA